MAETVAALAERHPDRTFACFNHTEDNVQEQFYAAVADPPGDFPPRR